MDNKVNAANADLSKASFINNSAALPAIGFEETSDANDGLISKGYSYNGCSSYPIRADSWFTIDKGVLTKR